MIVGVADREKGKRGMEWMKTGTREKWRLDVRVWRGTESEGC